ILAPARRGRMRGASRRRRVCIGPMGQWSLEMLRSVLDTAPEGIVVCEARPPDYPLVYANSAFCRMSGYALEELTGQDLRRLQSWDREQQARPAAQLPQGWNAVLERAAGAASQGVPGAGSVAHQPLRGVLPRRIRAGALGDAACAAGHHAAARGSALRFAHPCAFRGIAAA